MKSIYCHLNKLKAAALILLSVVLFSRCVDEIPMDISGYKEELIVNAIFDTSSSNHYIYVSRTGLLKPTPEKEADIKLFINDVQVKDPVPHTAYRVYHKQAYRPCFLSTEKFNPGDRIRLEVATTDGKHQTVAETAVPKSVGIDKISWEEPVVGKQYGTLYTTMTDPKDEKNFYQLRFAEEGVFEGKPYRRILSMNHSQEPVMNDGKSTATTSDEDSYFSSPNNSMGVFYDKWLNGTYTLKSGVRVAQIRPEAEYYVLLSSITEGFYFYLRAINTLESDDFIEGLTTPIILPSNVKGGKGYVAGVATERIQFSKK